MPLFQAHIPFDGSLPAMETELPGGGLVLVPLFFAAPGNHHWRILFLFLFLAAGISVLGWWAYSNESGQLRQREYDELAAITHFKATQVQDWLTERRWDAELLFGGRLPRLNVGKWLGSGDPAAREALKARFGALLANPSYVGVELLDRAGTVRLAVGAARHDPAEATAGRLAALGKSTAPRLVDLHRDGKDVRLAYLVPVAGPDSEAAGPVGYLRMTIDPAKALYPLVQTWPTPSTTAEVLLVRREGDQVVFLSDLRHLPDTALKLHLPLARADLPAAQAALGAEGIFEGRDYRGVEVLSYLRPIPGTPWSMVAKEDSSEVFREIRQVALVTALATAILLTLTAMVLWVTWRRQQLTARLRLQERLERIAEASPGVIHSYLLRPDGSSVFPYASPAIRDVFGYPPGALAEDASPVMARVHPDDAPRLKEAAAASARDLSVWHAEYRYRHPGKGEVWIEETSVPSRLPDGSTLWHGFISDVTARKRAERALRESELRFSTIFRESPLGITLSRLSDGWVLEANDAFLTICGRSRDAVVGQMTTELGLWKDVSDRSRALAGVEEEGALRNVQMDIPRPGGQVRHVLFSTAVIELQGTRYLLSLFSDITSLREAEEALAASRERYRLLFEHMLDGYFLGRLRRQDGVPFDFTCLDVNPAFEKLTGLGDVAGKWITDVIPGIRQSNPDLFDTFDRVSRTGEPAQLETYIGPLEQWFYIAVFSPAPDHFAAVFHNITERKAAQFALEAHRDQLEATVARRTAELVAANQELQAFTYAASHDLKAPLRGISGFATLLERDYRDRLEEDGARYLDHICKSAARMTALIDDLLAYARVEQQTGQMRNIALEEAVHAVLAEFQAEIQQRGARVEVELPPATVRADPHGLAQVLRNLIGNALKYSGKAAHPAVRIGGERRGECCRLWVRDNGIGFDMAYHDRIFEIFRRLHGSEDFQGTGVGLALVKKAVERMGGRVWAESAPGQGATFFLELPAP